MNNKKGFTLIELLAIIVILAVIMAIAIPQVLNVVNGSKESAWKDNIKMISKAIELNTQLYDPETGNYAYTVESLCKDPSKVNEISKSTDTTVTCSNDIFTIAGTGQFSGQTAIISCRNGNCSSKVNDMSIISKLSYIKLWQKSETESISTTKITIGSNVYTSVSNNIVGGNYWHGNNYENIDALAGEEVSITSLYGSETRWYLDNNEDAYLCTGTKLVGTIPDVDTYIYVYPDIKGHDDSKRRVTSGLLNLRCE